MTDEAIVAGDTLMGITGMTCTHCEIRVGEALSAAGAHDVVVHWQEGTARFTADGVAAEHLSAAVADAGYHVVSWSRSSRPRPAAST